MATVHINLSYPKLSTLLQEEINKQDINVKGYNIKIEKLVVNEEGGRLRVTGEIVSKWNAFFDFSALPIYLSDANKIDLQDIKLDLDAQNLLFKGVLKLVKGNIKNRIEKLIEKPLDIHFEAVKKMLDEELSKAPLPYDMSLASMTKDIKLEKIEALPSNLHITAQIDQEINLNL